MRKELQEPLTVLIALAKACVPKADGLRVLVAPDSSVDIAEEF